MKNSKKVFGLFAFLLICGNVNASTSLVGAPEEYPGIKYDYNNVNDSLPFFNFSENLSNGGNYIRVGENSKLNINSNLNIDLKSNIVSLLLPHVYGNEVGASDEFNAPMGMAIHNGANYLGEDIDINLITSSRPEGHDIIGLGYGTNDENVTRPYKSEMNVNNVNIKIQNNQVLTTNYGDNLLIGLWQWGDKNQNAHFISRGNLNIDINDKSDKAQYHAAAGIIVAGENGAKMTLNNSNIKISYCIRLPRL